MNATQRKFCEDRGIPLITTYQGRNIEDLTRDELLEALRTACGLLEDFMSPESIKARAFGRAEMMKRGMR